MLFPDGLSAEEQKKFFDHVIKVDYKPLFTPWGTGVPVYGKMDFVASENILLH